LASVAVASGEEQGAKAPASTRHSKTESPSFEMNANVGVESVVVALGPPVMVVLGEVVSGAPVTS